MRKRKERAVAASLERGLTLVVTCVVYFGLFLGIALTVYLGIEQAVETIHRSANVDGSR